MSTVTISPRPGPWADPLASPLATRSARPLGVPRIEALAAT